MTTDVVVLGSGPAARSASAALAHLGLDSVRLDTDPAVHAPSADEGTQGVAWAAFDEGDRFSVLAVREDKAFEVSARVVLCSEHASPNPIAVPGWESAGVVIEGHPATCDTIHAGRRVLVVGRGKGTLALAERMSSTGSEVVGIDLTDAEFHDERISALRGSGAKVRFGRRLIRIVGDGRVTGAVVADEGSQGVEGDLVEVDSVVLAFGLRSRPRFPCMLGCRVSFDETRGCWHVAQQRYRTSVDRVFVTGPSAGLADEQEYGVEAAQAVAASLGHRGVAEVAVTEELAGVSRLGICRTGAFVSDDSETCVCPCNSVSVRDLESGAAMSGGDMGAIRRLTGGGMGPCQGTLCEGLIQAVVARSLGVHESTLGPPRARPPAFPITLSLIRGVEV